jgi:hypothetical protein
MKIEIENSIKELRRKQSNIQTIIDNASEKINNSIKIVSNLKNLYQKNDTATKQRIIGSMFPANLYFEEKKVRTLELNKVVSLVFNTAKGLGNMKKEKHTDFGVLSCGGR